MNGKTVVVERRCRRSGRSRRPRRRSASCAARRPRRAADRVDDRRPSAASPSGGRTRPRSPRARAPRDAPSSRRKSASSALPVAARDLVAARGEDRRPRSSRPRRVAPSTSTGPSSPGAGRAPPARTTDSAAVKPAVPSAIASRGAQAVGQRHDPVGRHPGELGEAAVVRDADVVAVRRAPRRRRTSPRRRRPPRRRGRCPARAERSAPRGPSGSRPARPCS